MAAVHDLGGRPGFGPIPIDDDPPFATAWHAKAFAVTSFAQSIAGFNTDAFRHGLEREDPDTYLRLGYWGRWTANAERMLVEGGVIPADAVAARLAGVAPSGPTERTTDAVPPAGAGAHRRPDAPARFDVGESVRVGSPRSDGGHTRLPGYVAGRVGVIVRVNDVWVFPDTHAHGRGEQPQWVYAVAFTSSDLWPDDQRPGAPSHTVPSHTVPNHTVHVDLFESYLEPA